MLQHNVYSSGVQDDVTQLAPAVHGAKYCFVFAIQKRITSVKTGTSCFVEPYKLSPSGKTIVLDGTYCRLLRLI